MPSDTFNLQIFDTGISTPTPHASTHLTGGTDVIPTAVASVAGVGGSAGLMSALQAQQLVTNNGKVTNADHDGDVSGATTLTIGAGKVTTAKILDSAVVADKIASNAVTTNKIADGNVTLAKLANVDGPVVLGRSATDIGGVTAISCTTAGFALIGQPDVLGMQDYLELGPLATASALLVNLATDVGTSVLPVANGGTGVTTSTGTGAVVRAVSPTLTTPIINGATITASPTIYSANLVTPTLSGAILSTPASGVLTNCTGLPLTTGVTGVLPIANGGTGKTSAVRGQISKMSSFTLVDVVSMNEHVPITDAGTLDANVNMTVGANSTFSIKNTSNTTRLFRVYASVDATSAMNQILGIKLYFGVAGSLAAIDATECRGFTDNSNAAAKLVTSWMIELDHNKEIAVYVANHSGTNNITIQRARLIAEAII